MANPQVPTQPTTIVASPADDLVLPFRTDRSGVTGRLVRLGGLVDTILGRHDYPEAVSVALGEAIALTALLGTAGKFNGKLILQTKTDGPLGFLVADFQSATEALTGRLRGYAAFDAARTADLIADAPKDQGRLLGTGHMALTIDPGGHMDRHQGIVSLDAETLTTAAHTYFRQSEQLPTFIRLAVARHYSAAAKSWTWRAGGLMIQYVSPEGGLQASAPKDEDEGLLIGEREDDWQRTVMLAQTVQDHELLDPMLRPDRLLYRLFHEEGVRAREAVPLASYCSCSGDRVQALLKGFGTDELSDMREADGAVAVTCEFCTTTYRFNDDQLR
jgi:molecular chaperone Hsp33